MYNDPTEYDSHEPTEGVNYNPYETLHNPYLGNIPPLPPPPPTRERGTTALVIAIVSLLCLVFLLGGVLFVVLHSGVRQQFTTQQTIKLTPTPTLKPAIRPTLLDTTAVSTGNIPQAPYTARSIFNAFAQAGITMNNPHWDDNWKCCTYTPEGLAIIWTDPTGYNVDIATFAKTQEMLVDASQLAAQGLGTYPLNNCLLSFDAPIPFQTISTYEQIMNNACA